jgi:hypothetical protein
MRCPHHHYLTGWCCQLDALHAGPCLANAGVVGNAWVMERDRIGVYAWHQPPNEPACAQVACPSPGKCECADLLIATKSCQLND